MLQIAPRRVVMLLQNPLTPIGKETRRCNHEPCEIRERNCLGNCPRISRGSWLKDWLGLWSFFVALVVARQFQFVADPVDGFDPAGVFGVWLNFGAQAGNMIVHSARRGKSGVA